jgi:hypothetical protein
MNKDDIFHIDTREENGWHTSYVSLAWDNTKCTAAPAYASHDLESTKKIAIDAAIGRLWNAHADEIIGHIQDDALVADDIYVQMPPKATRTIKAKIICLGKAEPEV